MRKFMFLFVTLALTQSACAESNLYRPKPLPVTVTVQVVDDAGEPVEGEAVRARFYAFDRGTNCVEKTGKNGQAKITGKITTGRIGIAVGKFALGDQEKRRLDYYSMGCVFQVSRNKAKTGWEPSDYVVKLPVRKRENPVPMFGKNVNPREERGLERSEKLNFPSQVGFDMAVGDFVAPHGKGKVVDLVFEICPKEKKGDYGVRISFPNKGDGMLLLDPNDPKNCLPSATNEHISQYLYEFKGPRMAPEDGYVNELKWDELKAGKLLNKDTFYYTEDLKGFYVFRVRSRFDENGNLVGGCYGKFTDNFWVALNQGEFYRLIFSYLYNPDGTRNLEFDPERNLNRNRKTNNGFLEP